MNILKEKIQTELIIKNSRFINELFVCDSQSLVRQIIKEQKEKYTEDGLHFNDEGHKILAECLGQFLESL